MIDSLSSPPSSFFLVRLFNSRTPISHFRLRPKIHIPKSLSSPTSRSLSPSHLTSPAKPQFWFDQNSSVIGRRHKFKTGALPGLDFVGFDSARSVLEAITVLTAIIVVHESGHFLAAYLQGIHVSKFAVGFGPIFAKFNSYRVEYSVRAFRLGGFVGFPDNDPDGDIPIDDVNLLKNRSIFDRVLVVSAVNNFDVNNFRTKDEDLCILIFLVGVLDFLMINKNIKKGVECQGQYGLKKYKLSLFNGT